MIRTSLPTATLYWARAKRVTSCGYVKLSRIAVGTGATWRLLKRNLLVPAGAKSYLRSQTPIRLNQPLWWERDRNSLVEYRNHAEVECYATNFYACVSQVAITLFSSSAKLHAISDRYVTKLRRYYILGYLSTGWRIWREVAITNTVWRHCGTCLRFLEAWFPATAEANKLTVTSKPKQRYGNHNKPTGKTLTPLLFAAEGLYRVVYVLPVVY